MIKASDLHKVWGAPDNSRLTAKQFSFRLPVHVAARIAALCELYPNRTRTEIVGDLLSSALDEAVNALPSYRGEKMGEDHETGESMYWATGPMERFRRLANEHYEQLEKELGNESPKTLYEGGVLYEREDD